jgi:division protein CdvB (Snf7/Vps24/ESCRT-III family)
LWVDQVATKILAQQLIRLRQQIAKLQGSRAQIRGVATHTQVRGVTGWSS